MQKVKLWQAETRAREGGGLISREGSCKSVEAGGFRESSCSFCSAYLVSVAFHRALRRGLNANLFRSRLPPPGCSVPRHFAHGINTDSTE